MGLDARFESVADNLDNGNLADAYETLLSRFKTRPHALATCIFRFHMWAHEHRGADWAADAMRYLLASARAKL